MGGGFDPVDNPYGFEYSPVSTTYYDKEGSAVSFYPEDGRIDMPALDYDMPEEDFLEDEA